MSLSQERAIVKENKALNKQIEKLELEQAVLRADALERTTAFLDQMEVLFALVDFIFDGSEVRTLGEAQRKWQLFKTTVDESENAQAAIDALGIEINISHEHNQMMVMNWWQQDRDNHKRLTA